jgi:hypothetical protein
MTTIVSPTAMTRGAGYRIFGCNIECTFIHMVFMDFVQMSIMDIISMIPVLDGCMTTTLGMGVIVIGMSLMFHSSLPLLFFFCVMQSIQNQIPNMFIREGIVNMFSFPPFCHYPALL